MQPPIIDIVPANPDADGLRALSKTLAVFNAGRTGLSEYDPDFAIYIRDPETREIIGGSTRPTAMVGLSSSIWFCRKITVASGSVPA